MRLIMLLGAALLALSVARADAPQSAFVTAVDIVDFRFDPASGTTNVGRTITWTNRDFATHTVTFDDGVTPGSTGLNHDDTFAMAFAAPGSYPYHCAVHSSMRGVIDVLPALPPQGWLPIAAR